MFTFVWKDIGKVIMSGLFISLFCMGWLAFFFLLFALKMTPVLEWSKNILLAFSQLDLMTFYFIWTSS